MVEKARWQCYVLSLEAEGDRAPTPLITIVNCSETHTGYVDGCGPVNGCRSVPLGTSRLCRKYHLQESPELSTPQAETLLPTK